MFVVVDLVEVSPRDGVVTAGEHAPAVSYGYCSALGGGGEAHGVAHIERDAETVDDDRR